MVGRGLAGRRGILAKRNLNGQWETEIARALVPTPVAVYHRDGQDLAHGTGNGRQGRKGLVKIVVGDWSWPDFDIEEPIFARINAGVVLSPSSDEDTLATIAADADALLVEYSPITRRVIQVLKKCKVISVEGIGYDNVDVEAAVEAGIVVTNVLGYCVEEVSDHTLALIMACARGLARLNDLVRQGRWEIGNVRPIRLRGKALGIVGLGAIGRLVAMKAQGFGLELIGHDPFVPEDRWPPGVKQVDLPTLLRESDFITLHTPLSGATARLISKPEMSLVKKGAYLINTSRGGVVDEDALCDALASGTLAGAALDVTTVEPPPRDSRLLTLDNLLITPHVAYYSEESAREVRVRAAEQIVRVLSGEPATDPVLPRR
jgi:D-3-phosphoglycerate dehydrogenase